MQGEFGPLGYEGRKGRKGKQGPPGPAFGTHGKNSEMGDGSYMGLVSASEMAEVNLYFCISDYCIFVDSVYFLCHYGICQHQQHINQTIFANISHISVESKEDTLK